MPSTITLRISHWAAPLKPPPWYEVWARRCYRPALAVGLLLTLACVALAVWMLWLVWFPHADCWAASASAPTQFLFGDALSNCKLRAPTATLSAGGEWVVLRWPKLSGAAGYRIEEWSWQQILPGWYHSRQQVGSFSFLYNYGGTELPECGTARLFPQASCVEGWCELALTGRAALDVEWRYIAVKAETGEHSRWSPPSNRLELPEGLLSLPFDLAALESDWTPPSLPLPNNCCPVGSYRAVADALTERCSYCPPGSATPTRAAVGEAACEICPAGRYADAAAAPPLAAATAARFAVTEPGAGDEVRAGLSCTPCAAGTFASSDGSAVCERCPSGWSSGVGAQRCWAWYPVPVALFLLLCGAAVWCRRRRQRRLGLKYIGEWKRRTMRGPLSSRWRGEAERAGELLEDGQSRQPGALPIVAYGRGTHAAKAVAEAAAVGVRAAAGLRAAEPEPEPEPEMDAEPQDDSRPEPESESVTLEGATPALAQEGTQVLGSPCSVMTVPVASVQLGSDEPQPDEQQQAASGPGLGYRRFDGRNVHRVYAEGDEFAAHSALYAQPAGSSTDGADAKAEPDRELLTHAEVQASLRTVLQQATEGTGTGKRWPMTAREECRRAFEQIADGAAASEGGLSRQELALAVSAVLARLPPSGCEALAPPPPDSPATTAAVARGLAVVNALPPPAGMAWMVAEPRAALVQQAEEEARQRREAAEAEAAAKEERRRQRQEALGASASAPAAELYVDTTPSLCFSNRVLLMALF